MTMTSRKSEQIVWLFCIALLGSCAADIDRVLVDPSTGNFIASDGRTVLFHGVNVVHKSFPWHPSLGPFDAQESLNAGDMANLRSWGFNLVRLGVMWPGVEPARGQYNETYLEVMRQLVHDLHQHGIYTIVDFHQDSLSEQWCGEGIPAWMVDMLGPLETTCDSAAAKIGKLIGQCTSMKDFNIPIDPATGFPSTEGCLKRTFDAYSRTPELVSAWGHFYSNATIQTMYQEYWRKVSTTFAGSPGVIGYNLVNEPLGGNFYADPLRLKPGYLDEHVLQPMYKALHEVILSADPNAIAMYEPAPFPDTYPANIPLLGGVYPVGFTSGPAGEDFAHQSMSYHLYSCGFARSDCLRTGDTPSATCTVCDEYAEKAISTRDADAKRLGGGAFLTEFGACSGSEACIAEIHRVLNPTDAAMHSWAYWQFKYNHDITTVSGPMEGFYNVDGTLQHDKVSALSRTYAPAIAGRPRKTQFDPLTGAYRLLYDTEETTAHLQTDIFLNEDMLYKDSGYMVSAVNADYKKNGSNRLAFLATKAGLQVDLAIAKPYAGAAAGAYRSNDNDVIAWSMVDSDSATSPGFDFEVLSNITWWKSVKIYTDDGDLLCSLWAESGKHGPSGCDLSSEHRHHFLFSYRIEVWKAKTFGRHTNVDTIGSSYFGPLLSKRVRLTWVDDIGAAMDEKIVI